MPTNKKPEHKRKLKELIRPGQGKYELSEHFLKEKGIQGGCPLSADLDYILLNCKHDDVSVFGSATRPLLLRFTYEMWDRPKHGDRPGHDDKQQEDDDEDFDRPPS